MLFSLCARECNGGLASAFAGILIDTKSAITFADIVFSALADHLKFIKWKKAKTADRAAAKTTPEDPKKKTASNRRMTNPEAKKLAKKLGYWEVKDSHLKKGAHGNKVFTNGKNFITADRDVHSGGAWKTFDNSLNRTGTYDRLLKRRIGK